METFYSLSDPNNLFKHLVLQKLTAIEKLKREQQEGKELNRDQFTKINSESAVRKELEELQIQS